MFMRSFTKKSSFVLIWLKIWAILVFDGLKLLKKIFSFEGTSWNDLLVDRNNVQKCMLGPP